MNLKNKLFIEKTTNVWIQLFRYFFVGGIAFIADFSLLYILFDYVGVHYLLAAAFSFIVGLFVNYFISIKWVFNRENVFNRKMEFLLFALIGVVGLAINELIIWVITDKVGLYVMTSKLIATAIVFVWNFVARKYLLFKK